MVSRHFWVSNAKREIVDRIRSHGSSTPWRIAIEQGSRSITYRALTEQLDRRILQLTDEAILGRFVAIERPRSADFVVDFLAVLTLGGIPVPIDPELPAPRRELFRELVRAGVPTEGADGAYVFFTSGSTGVPRPVLGSATALRAFLEWQCAEFDLDITDRFAFLTALSFDVAVRDMFPPLWTGATLVIPAPGECDSPEATVAWLDRRGISVLNAVPSVARSWLRHGQTTCESVRTVFFAGEPLPAALLEEWHATFPGTRTRVNFYGTTETTLPKVYKRLSRVEEATGTLAVGYPVPRSRFCLIDPASPSDPDLLRDALASTLPEGEVVLVSRYHGHGYVGMPEQTAERFVELGGDLTAYRTGDLGRLDPTGELVVLGRIDDEVKINGVRIHPAEVAAAIRGSGLVADAFVMPGRTGGLTAYVVAMLGGALDPAELRGRLTEVLPPAMIPGRFVVLPELPELPNGKVDRAALRELADRPAADRFVAPSGELEGWLADRWAELFDRGPVSATADFFELGGDSIAAMQLSSRIRRDLGVTLSVRDIFTGATITAIARQVADRQFRSVEPHELLAMLATVEGVGSHD